MTESQIQSFLVAQGSALRSFKGEVKSRGHETSSKTGDVICTAFQGGATLSASTIIYRTQVACGISAKVILVTLQKEQGLITRPTASKSALDRAMGYACPDTAPCAEYALGFGNQVFMGARQMKIYKAAQFAKQPGVHAIAWHPNPDCGSSTFRIQNYATAALYNYTPYRPNAAALASYPGTGDACSSYGNRNFWFFHHAWFGNPVAIDGAFAINEAYRIAGGASSDLGAESKTLVCPTGRTACWQEYENGYITWTFSGGPHISSGEIAGVYKELGGPVGPVGYATSNIKPTIEPTHGNGEHQLFAGGVIHKSASGTFLVPTKLQAEYSEQGWVRGELGWPTAAITCGLSDNGCFQPFQNGSISYVFGSLNTVSGAAETLYRALGGHAGPLGLATSSTKPVVERTNGDGSHQFFAGGVLHSSSAGTFFVSDPIMAKYSALRWVRGSLGWPIADEVCGLPDNGCMQKFQHGTIYVADGHPAQGIDNGPLESHYEASGGPAGSLGYPTSSTKPVVERTNGDGLHQFFEGGVLHSSSAGTFLVKDPILAKYSGLGWVRGSLGWPIADEVCGLPDNGCMQKFQHGTIYVADGHPAQGIDNGPLESHYEASGGPAGSLGYPTSSTKPVVERTNGDGLHQFFEGGVLHSSSAGTFLVKDPILAKYSGLGWVRGSLGWPVAAEVCGLPNGGCSQQFAHGTLYSK
ncbi:MAG: hypothetical protein WED09_06130 [Homoserinimonas sp.]